MSKDLAVLVVGLVVTTTLALVAGGLFVPRLGPNGLPSSTQLGGTMAILVATGDISGRFLLDRSLLAQVGDTEGGTARALDLGISYASPPNRLDITAHNAGVDDRLTGDRIMIGVTLNGERFEVSDSACSVELDQLHYVVLRPLAAVQAGPPRGVPLPAFAGRLECQDLVSESGRSVSLSGVFRVVPGEE
ncbi:MAG: hypothetical protein WD651_08595 [Acidimicrobiia bacterium]